MEQGKKYYWLKLQHDFFTSLRIKKLRKLAGGDTYTIIYLKMQLKSLSNGGVLTYTGVEKTFAEEIALDIDESADDVAVTIQYLLATGLLETDDEMSFAMPYAIQNTGSETGAAERMRRMRGRNNVTPQLRSSYTEKDIEKELDIEKDTILSENVREIVNYLNEKAGTKYRAGTKDTVKHIRARLSEGYTVDDFKIVIDKKVAEWQGTKMAEFLRPMTLFGTKFESYLNAKNGEGAVGPNKIALRERTKEDDELYEIFCR